MKPFILKGKKKKIVVKYEFDENNFSFFNLK